MIVVKLGLWVEFDVKAAHVDDLTSTRSCRHRHVSKLHRLAFLPFQITGARILHRRHRDFRMSLHAALVGL